MATVASSQGESRKANKTEDPDMSELIRAVYDKMSCLVDPHLLFKEVTQNLMTLNQQFDELKHDMESVKKEIKMFKHHRLKQFMWVKEKLTQIEMDRDDVKEDLEKKTNTITKCLWMTEAAIRDHIVKDDGLLDMLNIAGLSPCKRSGSDSGSTDMASAHTGPLATVSADFDMTSKEPATSTGTPDGSTTSPQYDTGSTITDDETTPRAPQQQNINSNSTNSTPNLDTKETQTEPDDPDIDHIFPIASCSSKEEVSNRLVTAVLSITSRMHLVEKSHENWKQAYAIQVNGLRAQMQQVQQDAVDMTELYDEVIGMKRAYEDPDEKGLENKFMHTSADLIARLSGRIDNLERALEKERNSDFKAFAKSACNGVVNLSKSQITSNELIRRTQKLLDERKALKAAKAIRVKEEMEMKQAMKFAHMIGSMRSNSKTDSNLATGPYLASESLQGGSSGSRAK